MKLTAKVDARVDAGFDADGHLNWTMDEGTPTCISTHAKDSIPKQKTL